ncbi:MAG TPA: MSMEG_4193 family putative phosphomutase [Actinomycetes bacterium]|nr:MSMEG_4193 family putative phosphomutase [Actinomycetes bacterium]
MTTVLLIRHGRTAANAGGVLAGWTTGVGLDDHGRDQATRLGERLARVPLAAVVSSPLDRALETAAHLVRDRAADVPVHVDNRVGEVRYGDWTGQPLKQLAKDPLWKVVQAHPSGATFPGDEGESLASMQARAVSAVREWNRRLGEDAVYAVVSHGDVIKALLADALGQHLDSFQRIVVDPASLSVVRFTALRPFVERMNDTGGSVDALVPRQKGRRRKKPSSDAAIGGGAGEGTP